MAPGGLSNTPARTTRQYGSTHKPGLPGKNKVRRPGPEVPKPAKVRYSQSQMDKFLAAKQLIAESAVGNLFRITLRTSSVGELEAMRYRHSVEYRRSDWHSDGDSTTSELVAILHDASWIAIVE